MNVAVVVPRIVPHPTGGGVAIVTWAVIRHLVETGRHVTAYLLLYPSADGRSLRREEEMEALSDLGVEVVSLALPVESRSRWRRGYRLIRAAVHPTLGDLYPSHDLAPRLSQLVESARPDVMYLYTLTAVAAAGGVSGVPRLAALVDLDHLVRRYHWRHSWQACPLRFGVSSLRYLAGRRQPRVTIELLSRCEVVVEHAAHHVAWLRRNGIQNCLYFPNPVDDAGGPEWEARRESSATEGKPKILMAGHLRGIATLSGLHLLADETLPILERILGPDGFEVHIVGADALPPRLAAKLARPSVRLRGYVEDIHQEFLTSDVLFVPTPIELGFRTRIAEGFSFGCCVVAHSANALGMPELVHRENALLAPDGAGLADQLVRALGDPALRSRLRRNARQTYEQKLDSRLVCASIAAELERIASSPKARELA